MEVNIGIGFWTLKVICTHYGICGEVALKNARAMVFSKSRGVGRSFQSGPKNPDFFMGQLSMPVSTSPNRKALRGEDYVCRNSTLRIHSTNNVRKLHFKWIL